MDKHHFNSLNCQAMDIARDPRARSAFNQARDFG